MNWNKYPFLRMVLFLALGIAACEVFKSFRPSLSVLFVTLLGLLAVLLLLHHLLKSYRYRWIFGLCLMVTLVVTGFARARIFEAKVERSAVVVALGKPCRYVARVLEPPTEKENSVRALLQLSGHERVDSEKVVRARVMAYLPKTEEALGLHYGDQLVFEAIVEAVAPPRNPEEFDYRTYLLRRGMVGRVYLKDGDWTCTGLRQINPIFAFGYRLRGTLLKALRDSGLSEDEFGVGAAVLLGDDDFLPAQVRHNYVAAGAMHVLCVSGMHVGIIFLLASFVLGFLGNGHKRYVLKRILLLLLVWGYALLTGLSPSVMRSSLMITFWVFGELIHRKGYALNSIAASAFFLLLLQPNNLFAIGFQLSYVAVTGIVLLQKPISQLLYFEYPLLNKVWDITAVSLAAQISTMPFTVYYFHQFTPYFWLSNLFLTPISFFVIMSGMLFLSLSWVPFLDVLLGKMVWLSLKLMNVLVAWVEQMPCSLVKGLYMDNLEFGLSMVMLVLLFLLVQFRKKRMMMELLVVGAVFSLSLAWRGVKASTQQQLVVYSLNNHTALDVISGTLHCLICDDALLSDPSVLDYSVCGNWARLKLFGNPSCYDVSDDIANSYLRKKKHLLSFQGILLAFWDPLTPSMEGPPLVVDGLMVRNKQRPELSRIAECYQMGVLLIDGSVPSYLAKEWEQQADALQIPYINVREACYCFF